MPIQELSRERLEELQISSLLESLALKAEALLGYSWLRRRLGIPVGALHEVLARLEIEPFPINEVTRYKTEKARQVISEIVRELRAEALGEGYRNIPIGSRVNADWRLVDLRKYDGYVPEFAISRSVEIKQHLPAAQFYIDELRVDKRYDPFLVVSCGAERFYIDVWDEPEFERAISHNMLSVGT
jgi:hypothetical protein